MNICNSNGIAISLWAAIAGAVAGLFAFNPDRPVPDAPARSR